MHFKKNLSKLVNFCAAILILKMEDVQHFWHIMLYYFKNGKNATETQKKICADFGEGAMTDQMCHKWFVIFLANFLFWPNNSAVGLFSTLEDV